jgi:hypothetical protein
MFRSLLAFASFSSVCPCASFTYVIVPESQSADHDYHAAVWISYLQTSRKPEAIIQYVHLGDINRMRRQRGEPSARGYNWDTLFLGDINTGIWPSRLRESQELGQ